jgi:hypothetical protein
MFHICTLRSKVSSANCLRGLLQIKEFVLRFPPQLNIEFAKEIILGEVGVNPTLSRNREKFISSRITQMILIYPTVEDCGAENLI